jgi:hypothetical protein
MSKRILVKCSGANPEWGNWCDNCPHSVPHEEREIPGSHGVRCCEWTECWGHADELVACVEVKDEK